MTRPISALHTSLSRPAHTHMANGNISRQSMAMTHTERQTKATTAATA